MESKSVLGKIVLWVSAVTFISYGLICLIAPDVPAQYAGLRLGLFCLLAALNPNFYKTGLVVLIFCIGSLALARLYSTLLITDPVSAYTWGAMTYEFATTILATLALRKTSTR